MKAAVSTMSSQESLTGSRELVEHGKVPLINGRASQSGELQREVRRSVLAMESREREGEGRTYNGVQLGVKEVESVSEKRSYSSEDGRKSLTSSGEGEAAAKGYTNSCQRMQTTG